MGNYTTTSDVERLLDTMLIDFEAETEPYEVTTADVSAWIDGYEAEIDGILTALGYSQIPVEGTRDIALFRDKVAERTAAKVWAVKYHSNDFPDAVREWLKTWELFIASLEKGRRRLLDQSPATPQAGVIGVGYINLTSVHPKYTDGVRRAED